MKRINFSVHLNLTSVPSFSLNQVQNSTLGLHSTNFILVTTDYWYYTPNIYTISCLYLIAFLLMKYAAIILQFLMWIYRNGFDWWKIVR